MMAAHKTLRVSLSVASTLALMATVHCGGPVATPEGEPSNAAQAQLTVQSAAAQKYFSAANANSLCQTEQAALNKALSDLTSNPSGSLDAFNAAMQAFMKCVASQAGGDLPPVPGQSCTAEVVNGKLQTSGDCSQCKVVQNGGSVSVSCSSSGSSSTGSTSGGGTGGTTTTTTGGGTTTTTTTGGGSTGSLPPDGGTGTGGNGCTTIIVNGQVTTSGDCSHCTVSAQGAVSCTSSN